MRTSEILMYLGFFLIICGPMIMLLSPMEEVKTDCFDRYGSQIEGLECNKNVMSNEWFSLASILCFLFGFMTLMASLYMSFEESMKRW